jgi:hypothetical protein
VENQKNFLQYINKRFDTDAHLHNRKFVAKATALGVRVKNNREREMQTNIVLAFKVCVFLIQTRLCLKGLVRKYEQKNI